MYPSSDGADLRPHVVPHAPAPPKAALHQLRKSLLATSYAQVERLGLDPESASLDSIVRHLAELSALLLAATTGAFRVMLHNSNTALTRLYLVRVLEETYTRSGAYCTAELSAALSSIGASLFPGTRRVACIFIFDSVQICGRHYSRS